MCPSLLSGHSCERFQPHPSPQHHGCCLFPMGCCLYPMDGMLSVQFPSARKAPLAAARWRQSAAGAAWGQGRAPGSTTLRLGRELGNFAMARAAPSRHPTHSNARVRLKISGAPQSEPRKAAPAAVPARGRGVAAAARRSAPFRKSRWNKEQSVAHKFPLRHPTGSLSGVSARPAGAGSNPAAPGAVPPPSRPTPTRPARTGKRENLEV